MTGFIIVLLSIAASLTIALRHGRPRRDALQLYATQHHFQLHRERNYDFIQQNLLPTLHATGTHHYAQNILTNATHTLCDYHLELPTHTQPQSHHFHLILTHQPHSTSVLHINQQPVSDLQPLLLELINGTQTHLELQEKNTRAHLYSGPLNPEKLPTQLQQFKA